MATKRKFVAALAALSVGAALLGVPAPAPAHAIANGDRVPAGRYPFAAKITSLGIPTPDGGTRDSSCSGGLVSPRWVLTAAHCFRDVDGNRVAHTVAEETTVTVGRAGFRAAVVEVRQHGRADIALARLDRPVDGVAPLRLNRRKPATGLSARLVGYGFTSRGATRTPDRPRTGRFEITSVSRSEMGLSGVAPRQNTSPCERDSGGPYFTEPRSGGAVVVGVVSRGPDCPHTGPDIATRVDAVAPWILGVIKSDLASPSPATTRPSPPVTRPAVVTAPPAPSSSYPLVALVLLPVGVVALIALLLAGSRRSRRGHRRR